jgi:hypothetical protein
VLIGISVGSVTSCALDDNDSPSCERNARQAASSEQAMENRLEI